MLPGTCIKLERVRKNALPMIKTTVSTILPGGSSHRALVNLEVRQTQYPTAATSSAPSVICVPVMRTQCAAAEKEACPNGPTRLFISTHWRESRPTGAQRLISDKTYIDGGQYARAYWCTRTFTLSIQLQRYMHGTRKDRSLEVMR